MHTRADRKRPYIRAFIWLCDDCEGVADMQELGRVISGTSRGGPIQQIGFTLHKLGWAQIEQSTDHPKQPVTMGRIRVTPIGWIMRDYMRHEGELVYLDRVEMFSQIRALRAILAPLARAGRKWRTASTAQRDILRIALEPLGLSVLQLDMAAAILYPEIGLDKLVFPWTPTHVAANRKQLYKEDRKTYADEILREFGPPRNSVRNLRAIESRRSWRRLHDATASGARRQGVVDDNREVDGVRSAGLQGDHAGVVRDKPAVDGGTSKGET